MYHNKLVENGTGCYMEQGHIFPRDRFNTCVLIREVSGFFFLCVHWGSLNSIAKVVA